VYLQDPRSHPHRSKTSLSLAPCGIISNSHREDAKNAKKAVSELVHNLFTMRLMPSLINGTFQFTRKPSLIGDF
jgi:hypothetical protein